MNLEIDFKAWLEAEQNAIDNLESQIDSMDKTIADLNVKITALILTGQDDKATIQSMQVELDNTKAQLVSKQAEIDDLKVRLANAAKDDKPQIWGVNAHLFDSPIYKDINAFVTKAKELKFNAVRVGFFLNADGTIVQENDFLTRIYPALAVAGLRILPMLNTTGLSESSNDLPGQYKLGYAVGNGFAAKYGELFNNYELGNERALRVLTSGKDGRVVDNYDKAEMPVMASYLKGMFDGVKAARPKAITSLNCEWLHTGFVDYMRANGVLTEELTWHWYTGSPNQDSVLGSQGWNKAGMLIEDYLAAKYPGVKITFNEVGFTSPTLPFSQADQTAKLIPLLKRLKSKGYGVVVYELYDQADRLPSVIESNYGLYDVNSKPKAIVEAIKNI